MDEETVTFAAAPAQPQSAPAPSPAFVPPKLITFDVWFTTAERACARLNQPHHKAGMKAWTRTSGKRTKDEWDRLFSKY
jgi:hypothetical protein